MNFKAITILNLTFLLFIQSALASTEKAQDIASRFTNYSTSYTINEDGSFTENTTWSIKLLKKQAVVEAKQASISYSTSIQKAEVLEAYTLKANGKHVNSPKDNFQITASGGKDKSKAIFSDRTTLTVVFPDVEIGDTVVFHYRLTATEPIFPQHFSESGSFYKNYAYDNLTISFNAPESFKLNYEIRDFKEIKNSVKDKRHEIVWTWQNKEPIINNRSDYSVYNYDEDAGYSISTFTSNSQIAEAYGKRATPKAAVTDRIRKLADEISVNKTTERDLAKSLYEWVALNISYAGNCVGLGAVVPHDIDFILDNRMGDCKDHATLLQALLAAKNIKSVQALVNASSIYKLPKIPVVSMVNHVINYIPSLDLYVDSTSDSTPFGMLPTGDQDKYVLLVDGSLSNTKTPIDAIGANEQTLTSKLTIKTDGSVDGETKVTLKGTSAVSIRARARESTVDQEKNAIKNYFKYQNKIATGEYKKDDPKALIDTYGYSATYQVKELLSFSKTGVIAISPIFGSGSSIGSYLYNTSTEDETFDIVCYSGKSSENLIFEFPKELKIISIPDNFELANDTLFYSAKYDLQNNVLTVSRVFDDKTKGNVCSAKTMKEYDDFIKKVKPNYDDQVIYKKM
jgi:transglutaminase-like putative cysteine protease